MKKEILKLLREADGYISGQQICGLLQVSRTAVWKVIGQLKEEGYQIEAVRNKGYRLLDVSDILSDIEVAAQLKTRWAGCRVIYYDNTDSTNDRAKALGEAGERHGTLAIAGRQTSGKGRRGRMWESPPDANIYMSILVRPDIMPAKAPMLTLVMALSAAHSIHKLTGLEAKIKWPNDIVINGRKVCGILTEMSAEIDYINYVVTGIGINVNQVDIPSSLAKRATSIKREYGKEIRRVELIACIMEQYEKYYEIFMDTKDLSAVQEEYNRLLVNKDRDVRVLEPGHEYEARALGISETGELLVRTPDGQQKAVYAGEVSVRGVYGYM